MWETSKSSFPILSWDIAAKQCIDLGGYLPHFSSRDDLARVLSIFKFSEDLQLTEALFVGLKWEQRNNDSKVKRISCFAFVLELTTANRNNQALYLCFVLFFCKGSFWWQKLKPVSFQIFENLHYGQTSASCLELRGYTLPHCVYFVVKAPLLKKKMLTTTYPSTAGGQFCTLMLMTNLAVPEWINVDCSDHILCDVMCAVTNTMPRSSSWGGNNDVTDERRICGKKQVHKGNKCFKFVWYNYFDKQERRLCEWNQPAMMQYIGNVEQEFHFLFNATSTDFPVIIVSHRKNCTVVETFVYRKHLSVFETHKSVALSIEANGLVIFAGHKHDIVIDLTLFYCSNGGYILFLHRCDGDSDCQEDNSDELMCDCESKAEKKTFTETICKSFAAGQSGKTCGVLYHMSTKGDCFPYSIENENKVESHRNTISSTSSFPHEEVPQNHKTHCAHQAMLACSADKPICYEINRICLYEVNEFGMLIPCRNGDHLDNCESFDCVTSFKCEGSYCIPWESVCDGKWDCAFGYEEIVKEKCANHSTCKEMYKCNGSRSVCVHLGNICDGRRNCPHNDDEQFCQLHEKTCVQHCSCLGFAINCNNVSIIFEQVHKVFVAVRFENLALGNLNTLPHFLNIMFLVLVKSGIKQLCVRKTLTSLMLLDLSFNSFEKLEKNCYSSLAKLKAIKLDNNAIGFVHSKSLVNLSVLLSLDFNGNPLTTLAENVFAGCQSLKIIYLDNTTMADTNKAAFPSFEVDVIATDNYYICCVALERVRCTAEKPWHISCSDLLPDQIIQIFYICVSCLSFASNGLSIAVHILTWKDNRVFSVHVLFINSGDTLCSLYLQIIWIADLLHAGIFLFNEKHWRSSPGCFAASEIVLWFTLSTQLLLIFLCLGRLMIVLQPVDTKFKRLSFVVTSLSCVTIFSFLVSLAIIFSAKFVAVDLPTGLCLPFVDPTEGVLVIKVITWLTVTSQTISSVIIVFLHAFLVFQLSKTQKSVQKAKSSQDSNVVLLCQLVLITVSNILCWFPTNTIYVTALFLTRYPINLVIWSTVTLMPLNSIINPSVFSFMGIRKIVFARQKSKGLRQVKFPV